MLYILQSYGSSLATVTVFGCLSAVTACLLIAEFSFDGFSVDLTRSMVAMSDVSFLGDMTVSEMTLRVVLFPTILMVVFMVNVIQLNLVAT